MSRADCGTCAGTSVAFGKRCGCEAEERRLAERRTSPPGSLSDLLDQYQAEERGMPTYSELRTLAARFEQAAKVTDTLSPEVLAWALLTAAGNIRIWSRDKALVMRTRTNDDETLVPVIAAPASSACRHRIADAHAALIEQGGYYCVDCGEIFAAADLAPTGDCQRWCGDGECKESCAVPATAAAS